MINRAKLMEKGLGDYASTLFPNPNPTLQVFSNQIVVTDKAQTAVASGKGLAAARDVEVGSLVGMMESELVYMQGVADAGNPDQAAKTLQAGGVDVAAVALHDKAVLTVKQGPTSGAVLLEANASTLLGANLRRKHFFCWQYTTDGAKTFVNMPSTPDASTSLTGLTPLATVGFRVAPATKGGVMGEWSQVVNFLVH